MIKMVNFTRTSNDKLEKSSKINTKKIYLVFVGIISVSLLQVAYAQTVDSESAADSYFTPSVSLDRTVYPVPFGQVSDFADDIVSIKPDGRSVFPLHLSTIVTGNMRASETLDAGDLMLHIRINDPSFDLSSSNVDTVSKDVTGKDVGPLKISVSRDSQTMVLAYVGGSTPNKDGLIDVGDDDPDNARQLGPITEIAPDAGIFELDFIVRYTDGPSNQGCPATASFTSLNENMFSGSEKSRFDEPSPDNENYCIMGGDILTVEYAYLDESGNIAVASDAATFDLRSGVLLSDKEVYTIGSDMILTLIDPDLDLDNYVAETYSLDLIEWDSQAATMTMGQLGGETSSFNPEPSAFRETGDSTGMFIVVIEIPDTLQENNLEQGEEIILEYTDWSVPGAEYVGKEDKDVQLTLYTSYTVPSPYKQMKNGVTAEEVMCNDTLEKLYKSNGHPICVKSSSVEKLIQRGYEAN